MALVALLVIPGLRKTSHKAVNFWEPWLKQGTAHISYLHLHELKWRCNTGSCSPKYKGQHRACFIVHLVKTAQNKPRDRTDCKLDNLCCHLVPRLESESGAIEIISGK